MEATSTGLEEVTISKETPILLVIRRKIQTFVKIIPSLFYKHGTVLEFDVRFRYDLYVKNYSAFRCGSRQPCMCRSKSLSISRDSFGSFFSILFSRRPSVCKCTLIDFPTSIRLELQSAGTRPGARVILRRISVG